MKKLITLAAMLMATSTLAHTWSEILSDARLVAKLPSVKVSNKHLPVKVTGLCIDGEVLRTKNPVKKCNNFERRGQTTVCTDSSLVYGTAPLEGTKTVCTQWERRGESGVFCKGYETVNYSIETSYDVDVHEARLTARNVSRIGRFLFSKEYTIQACN